jgi:hypothetical protein
MANQLYHSRRTVGPMIELLFEILFYSFWHLAWHFPVWVGSNVVYYGTFGTVVCDEEILVGIIGIVFLIVIFSLLGYFVFRH